MLGALEGRPRAAGLLAWLRLVRVFQRVDRVSSESLRCHGISSAQLDVLDDAGAVDKDGRRKKHDVERSAR